MAGDVYFPPSCPTFSRTAATQQGPFLEGSQAKWNLPVVAESNRERRERTLSRLSFGWGLRFSGHRCCGACKICEASRPEELCVPNCSWASHIDAEEGGSPSLRSLSLSRTPSQVFAVLGTDPELLRRTSSSFLHTRRPDGMQEKEEG